ncbi:hypothetical protein ATANTOWER_032438 [Ataeniobius toweri]|uniref:Uncharacterized protein n=1 Tax=Ataeniobius toweri TaxID=208326 RepID=A0ABU7CE30_9TELE|nr:hypothetical protein [Ataeniobius toweri]
MERSQSRISLSASFEALAIYFPCMNSFDEDDGDESRFTQSSRDRHERVWRSCSKHAACNIVQHVWFGGWLASMLP